MKKRKELPVEQFLLFGSPQIIDGECFSSWLARVAARHGRQPLQIARMWGCDSPADADFSSDHPPIELLAATTFCSADKFTNTFSLSKTLLSDSSFTCFTNDGEMYLQPTYRYCPTCIKEDDIPYLRTEWRLSYSFVCQKHMTLLRDRCMHCQTRLDISAPRPTLKEVSNIDLVLAYCPQCGGALPDHPLVKAPDVLRNALFDFQCRMHKIIKSGFIRHQLLGTISSSCWARTYLTTDMDPDKEDAIYTGINFRAAFGYLSLPLEELLRGNLSLPHRVSETLKIVF